MRQGCARGTTELAIPLNATVLILLQGRTATMLSMLVPCRPASCHAAHNGFVQSVHLAACTAWSRPTACAAALFDRIGKSNLPSQPFPPRFDGFCCSSPCFGLRGSHVSRSLPTRLRTLSRKRRWHGLSSRAPAVDQPAIAEHCGPLVRQPPFAPPTCPECKQHGRPPSARDSCRRQPVRSHLRTLPQRPQSAAFSGLRGSAVCSLGSHGLVRPSSAPSWCVSR